MNETQPPTTRAGLRRNAGTAVGYIPKGEIVEQSKIFLDAETRSRSVPTTSVIRKLMPLPQAWYDSAMQSPGRRLFNLAAAISLTLCIFTIAITIYTYFYMDGWNGQLRGRHTTLISSHGRISLVWTSAPPQAATLQTLMMHNKLSDLPLASREQTAEHSFLGFGYENRAMNTVVFTRSNIMGGTTTLIRETPTTTPVAGLRYHRKIVVPLWMPALLTTIIPLLWLRHRYTMRHLRQAGFCPNCGYDLRATPDRCPECGKVCARPAEL